MDTSKLNLEALRALPLPQKLGLLGMVLGIILVMFYYYSWEPMNVELAQFDRQIHKLDKQIQTLTIKVKHLAELAAATKALEIELAKKKERLPPKEEAVMLLKQLTDLGVKLGLDIKLWRPGKQTLDATELFVKMPVNVELTGGYHTVALFFDRVAKLPRIINVSNLRMGGPKFKEGRTVIQTVFDLTAYAAP